MDTARGRQIIRAVGLAKMAFGLLAGGGHQTDPHNTTRAVIPVRLEQIRSAGKDTLSRKLRMMVVHCI